MSDAPSLLFTWEETRPDLEPIALLAHQDVVPRVAAPKMTGSIRRLTDLMTANLYGDAALDMKNHLIAVIQTVETLLGEGFKPERTVYPLLRPQ